MRQLLNLGNHPLTYIALKLSPNNTINSAINIISFHILFDALYLPNKSSIPEFFFSRP
jgi:hypothetical protein